MPRGGKRTGAGRPPSDRIPFGCKLRPDTLAELRKRILRNHRSAFVDQAIRTKLKMPPINPQSIISHNG
jgi:hypothetical protein